MSCNQEIVEVNERMLEIIDVLKQMQEYQSDMFGWVLLFIVISILVK